MAIINKNLTTQQYTDQHKPILIDWDKRSFNFQEDYIVSVDKDMNSQLLEFLSAPEYDGVDLYGTNVYVNYLTDWSLDGEHISQGSILLDTNLVDSQLKIKWLLNQLQTYKPGKVNFDLTFQIEQEFDSQYYVSWKDSTNKDFALNTWFYIINPSAPKASWILAIINDINEFEKVKNSVAGSVQTCITIGDATTDTLYDEVNIEPSNWAETYKLYYKKSGSTYVLNDSADFDSTNCYLRKYIGLAYKPAYVLKTLPGKFEVAESIDVLSNIVFPMSAEGQIDFQNYATITYVDTSITTAISKSESTLNAEISSLETSVNEKVEVINEGITTLDNTTNSLSTNLSSLSTEVDGLSTNLTSLTQDVNAKWNSLLNMVYPVGSIYMSVNNVSPQTFWSGTWEQIQDRFLLSAGTTYSAGTTGGEATHTLTEQEMPNHRHGGLDVDQVYKLGWGGGTDTGHNLSDKLGQWSNDVSNKVETGFTGGSQPHNNMPPYLTVYMWKRTA